MTKCKFFFKTGIYRKSVFFLRNCRIPILGILQEYPGLGYFTEIQKFKIYPCVSKNNPGERACRQCAAQKPRTRNQKQ